jgi:hypothetical protein
MKKLFLILLGVICLCSCELQQNIPKGKIYYVGVALDYQNTNVNSLYGTLNDGLELEKALATNAFKVNRNFKSYPLYQQGFSHSKETIEKKSYPSVEHIFEAFDDISKQSTDNDITIFYFSGHGAKDEGSILCGTTNQISGRTLLDLNKIDDNFLINPTELKQKLDKIKGKKLIIIDACHSGFFRGNLSTAVDITKEDATLSQCYEKFFKTPMNVDESIFLLCATEYNNYSHEPSYMLYSHPHGYFSKALLEGLGWCYGEKGIVTHKSVPYLVDNHDVQGILAEGNPPACGISNHLSVDDLYYYIKTHQQIPLIKKGNDRSFQHPCVTGGRQNLILFDY